MAGWGSGRQPRSTHHNNNKFILCLAWMLVSQLSQLSITQIFFKRRLRSLFFIALSYCCFVICEIYNSNFYLWQVKQKKSCTIFVFQHLKKKIQQVLSITTFRSLCAKKFTSIAKAALIIVDGIV